MTGRRIKRSGNAFERSWRAAVLAAAAISIGAAVAPPASAGLVKEVTDTVGSTVREVQAGAGIAPSLPGTAAPAEPSKPPVQAAPPALPPLASVKPPSKEPTPSPSPAKADSGAGGGAAEPPSAEGVAGAARETVDSVIGVGNEASGGAAPTERSKADTATPARQGGAPRASEAGASEAVVRERRSAPSSAVAVRAAEPAALQRWLARVWPAVALGDGGIGGLDAALAAITERVFRPALAAFTGLQLVSSPLLSPAGDPPFGGGQGVAGASRSAPVPPPVPSAGDGGGIGYLLAIAGLLGLLGFTVWREFRLALHPNLR